MKAWKHAHMLCAVCCMQSNSQFVQYVPVHHDKHAWWMWYVFILIAILEGVNLIATGCLRSAIRIFICEISSRSPLPSVNLPRLIRLDSEILHSSFRKTATNRAVLRIGISPSHKNFGISLNSVPWIKTNRDPHSKMGFLFWFSIFFSPQISHWKSKFISILEKRTKFCCDV